MGSFVLMTVHAFEIENTEKVKSLWRKQTRGGESSLGRELPKDVGVLQKSCVKRWQRQHRPEEDLRAREVAFCNPPKIHHQQNRTSVVKPSNDVKDTTKSHANPSAHSPPIASAQSKTRPPDYHPGNPKPPYHRSHCLGSSSRPFQQTTSTHGRQVKRCPPLLAINQLLSQIEAKTDPQSYSPLLSPWNISFPNICSSSENCSFKADPEAQAKASL